MCAREYEGWFGLHARRAVAIVVEGQIILTPDPRMSLQVSSEIDPDRRQQRNEFFMQSAVIMRPEAT